MEAEVVGIYVVFIKMKQKFPLGSQFAGGANRNPEMCYIVV